VSEPDSPGRRTLSEDDARWLLNRAIELDDGQSGSFTMDQLRTVATETGISHRALEQALLDLKERSAVSRPLDSAAEPGHIPMGALLRNVAPLVGGLLTIRMFLAALPTPDRPALIEAAIFPAGLLVGVLMANRLRAPLARFLLTGLALATGVQFLLLALTGEPVIRGGNAIWQLIGACYLVTAAGLLRFRSQRGGGADPPAAIGSRSEELPRGSWLATGRDWLRRALGPRMRLRGATPLAPLRALHAPGAVGANGSG